MVKEVRLLNNTAITLPEPLNGISRGGVMALNRLTSGTPLVLGRGIIRPNSESCLFIGSLEGFELQIEKALLHPLYPIGGATFRPVTSAGQRTWGFEDPTVLDPSVNWIEPGQTGCLITEAYYSFDRFGWIDGGMTYYGLKTGLVRPYVMPHQIMLSGLQAFFQDLNLVKEPQLHRLPDGTLQIYFEVGAQHKSSTKRLSRICLAEIDPSGYICNPRMFLDPEDPCTPDWMREHASTAGNPLRLSDGKLLTVFNGRNNECWQVGWCVHTLDGEILQWGNPIIAPPTGVEPGPDGQQIAFGSDVTRMSLVDQKLLVEILYHAQDRYPCLAIVEFELE